MKLVFIYGPPAVGKLTVATELGRVTTLAVFDDHHAINALVPIFGGLPKSLDKLVEQGRLSVIEEAACQGTDLIFTFVYAHPEDMPYVERICAAVERHGGTVCMVRLTCTSKAQEERVVHPDRAHFKSVNSVAIVRAWNNRYELRSPIPGRESLSIDTTNVLAREAAGRVAEHYGLEVKDLS